MISTLFCETADEADAAPATHLAGRVVIEPTVSAGSRDAGLFGARLHH